MSTILIKFKFDIESEIRRVKETLDNLGWLTKNNYRFLLPSNIKKDASTDDIKQAIENEYNLQIYQIAEKAILKSWEGNNKLLKKINQKLKNSYQLDEVEVILTAYGTQGSYSTPNSIIINISTGTPPEFLIKTVIHESLHLMIEHLIKRYSVEHWVKEHIVDLIMDLEYQSRFKMQSVPDWVLEIDPIFKKDYPNIDIITEKVGKIFPKK
ncbi:MAG: hypothetical protein ACOCU8_00285 [Patescibacteria group bacterium]